tara:strand:+ start:639 stop:2627 length:1989 start_codon:yes stop_codon:yes gene_type:complete
MPFTQFTNLDFDQIKTQIKDYLRANSNFTDFDFEGSNFSVLIDTLAYNTYINAFNANLVVNESFLDAATVRENVVSLARNIGYIPRSRSAAKAQVTFSVNTTTTSTFLTLRAGLVCVGAFDNTAYRFSIPEDVTATVVNGVATFGSTDQPLELLQGSFLSRQFLVDKSVDQRFILDNPNIDSASIRVFVKGINDSGLGREYKVADNILNLDKNSEIFLLQEVQDERYEILFGDGYFGRPLENNAVITVRYIVTDGKAGNGAARFDFQGNFVDDSNIRVVPSDTITVNTVQKASNGGDIENVSSIKYFAPRLYSAQYRAVTTNDYEAIIQDIYPNTESVAVVGGEELSPPKFGTVQISIKPKNGTYVSDFDKQRILNKLKKYAIAGINQKIIDLKVLYVEIDSSIYFNTSQVSNVETLKTNVTSTLAEYAQDVDMNRFGGRFKYSKILQLIDRVDSAITSNITKVVIRRDLKVLRNQFAQYELCFGNQFHVKPNGFNIKSTGFRIAGESSVVYLTDTPNIVAGGPANPESVTNTAEASNVFRTRPQNVTATTGILSIVKVGENGEKFVVAKDAGTVDYKKGEIILNTVNIVDTVVPEDIIEIQAFPESNDVVGLKDLYLSFDVSNSKINMIKDVIASGEEISGVSFTRDYYTSSYSNGALERK